MKQSSAKTAMQGAARYGPRALGVSLGALLGGPLVVTILFWGATRTVLFLKSGSFCGSLTSCFYGLDRIASLSYMFGLLPALIAGVWGAWLTYWHGTFGYRQAVLAAAISAFLFPGPFIPLGVLGMTQFGREAGILSVIGIVMVMSAIAAAVILRWFAAVLGLLPRPLS